MPGQAFFLREVGLREASALIGEVDRELKQGLRDRLKRAAKLLADEAKSRTHSRRVRSAISYDVEVQSLFDYRASIGPVRKRAFFAHFLEFGTVHSRAFPFLAPTLEAKEDQVVEITGHIPSLG